MSEEKEFTTGQIRQVLDLELGPNDSGEATVRGYLLRLLRDVWNQQEGFDGKRPFGNSSWDYDLKVPMVKAGLVSGKLDSDGYVEQLDDRKADALILAAISSLGNVDCAEHGQVVADLAAERAELLGRIKRIKAIAERGADL